MTKAQKVLYKTDSAFLTCTKELSKKDGDINFFEVQACVKEAREALAKADMLLGDSFSILAGYQQGKVRSRRCLHRRKLSKRFLMVQKFKKGELIYAPEASPLYGIEHAGQTSLN